MKNESRHARVALAFIIAALFALAGAALMGSVAALQFAYPGFLHDFSFVRSRPLHVSLAVAWIFLSAMGGIYYYLPKFAGVRWAFPRWPLWQLVLILITGTGILLCYACGIFGGREYWEHPQLFAIPIVISWLLLVINFFKSIFTLKTAWPAYIWMWATGILFFLITFLESNLWFFPWFRDHLVRDLTVQWKSYGALVGSWNMLVYGTAAFLAEKLSGDAISGRSRTAYLLYLLGFTNLLFGWAHHTYTIPSASWIRNISYLVSMSELLILARLIFQMRRNMRSSLENAQHPAGVFLFASDIWIFLNLAVALAISVPAVNLYSHGTHITVAHAMGSAIGINTMILLGSCTFIISHYASKKPGEKESRFLRTGIFILNFFLLVFWIALLVTGIEKGIHLMRDGWTFGQVMADLQPEFRLIAFSGLGLLLGLLMVVLPLLKKAILLFTGENRKEQCADS